MNKNKMIISGTLVLALVAGLLTVGLANPEVQAALQSRTRTTEQIQVQTATGASDQGGAAQSAVQEQAQNQNRATQQISPPASAGTTAALCEPSQSQDQSRERDQQQTGPTSEPSQNQAGTRQQNSSQVQAATQPAQISRTQRQARQIQDCVQTGDPTCPADGDGPDQDRARERDQTTDASCLTPAGTGSQTRQNQP